MRRFCLSVWVPGKTKTQPPSLEVGFGIKRLAGTYFSMSTLTRSSARCGFTVEFGKGSSGSRTRRPPGRKGGRGDGQQGEADNQAPKAWVLAGQAARLISTGRLHALLRVHRHAYRRCGLQRTFRSRKGLGSANLGGGFPLRCFQRLSRPDVATRRCHWRDNRYTRGLSIPVLSY